MTVAGRDGAGLDGLAQLTTDTTKQVQEHYPHSSHA